VGSGGNASGGSASGGNGGGGTASGGSASGGNVGSGGAGGTGGDATGGSARGGSASGGSGAGSGGAAGTSGSLHGGSSAKLNCAPGATYPASPLTGMGAITMVRPDNATTPNYFAFIEGPVWIGSLGKLFFSDNVSPERIWTLVPGMSPQVFKEMSGSNGMAVDNDDKLIVADQAMKRISRIDPMNAASVTVVVPAGNFKPNDVIVRSDGNIYFTDPDTGFYWFSTKGALTGPMKQVNRPNGIELSLDENTLIVGDVGNQEIHTLALAADGTVMTDTDKVFVKARSGTVDGMCTDCAGNLYAATSGGIEVYSPSAMYLGTVMTGSLSNCTFGGADRKTLYGTSPSALQVVTLGIPGLPD
jgi:gluconolactonase